MKDSETQASYCTHHNHPRVKAHHRQRNDHPGCLQTKHPDLVHTRNHIGDPDLVLTNHIGFEDSYIKDFKLNAYLTLYISGVCDYYKSTISFNFSQETLVVRFL